VVVVVGLRITDPLADVDANVPGVTAMPVAPVVAQFTVVVLPAMMVAGLAVKEEMVGAATSLMVGNFFTQPARPAKVGKRNSAQTTTRKVLSRRTSDCNV
jgi:hypothetical protein